MDGLLSTEEERENTKFLLKILEKGSFIAPDR
jgi:hypothetical protein